MNKIMRFRKFMEEFQNQQNQNIKWTKKGGNRWVGFFFVPDLYAKNITTKEPDIKDSIIPKEWIKYLLNLEMEFVDKNTSQNTYDNLNVQGQGFLTINASVTEISNNKSSNKNPNPQKFWDSIATGIKEVINSGAKILAVKFKTENYWSKYTDELANRLGFKKINSPGGGDDILVHPSIVKDPSWLKKIFGNIFQPRTSMDKNKMLELHNNARSQVGSGPLVINPMLEKAAQRYCQTMFSLNIMGHFADGTDPGQRAQREGFAGSVGENVLKGAHEENEAFKGWMESPGHKKNLLKPDWNTVGFGKVGEFWSASFGTINK